MEGMTTEGKLLAQDNIDTLLGQAGIEGNYQSEESTKAAQPKKPKKKPVIRFIKRSDKEVKATLFLLWNKASFKREDDVKVIWNSSGTIPMVSDLSFKIQDMEYISMGILRENHMIVKHKEKV